MSGVTPHHDRFFRHIFSRREAAIDLCREHLPDDVVACLALDSLEIVPGSYVDPEQREHVSDLVCRLELRDGGPAFVYVLVEHKSTPDAFVAVQLLRYVASLWDDHRREKRGLPLPPVIPLVFYHGKSRWRVPTELAPLLDPPPELQRFTPGFRYLIADLTRLTDDDVRSTGVARMAILAMMHVFRDDLRRSLARITEALETVPETEAVREALEVLGRYLSAASDQVSRTDLEEAARKTLPGKEGERIVATLAEQWMEEGAIATARESVLQVVEVRFGAVPDDLRRRIEAIEELSVLRELHKTAVAAPSLEDFGRAL
jgi:predicted transposase/invertase (TIGR01784 family)